MNVAALHVGGRERADAQAVGSGVLSVADLPSEEGGEWGRGQH